MYQILERIHGAEDVKSLTREERELLAEEIREVLFYRLTKKGGHFGPNFGFVEATIALHYVFDSPHDKFIFDVSHQSYTHKILTGRKAGYMDESRFHEDSGYTNPDESEHDLFNIGHTSTSVSLATGMAKGRDLLGGNENVIAIIGDGSLSGGEALEALNVAGSELESNLIIIVNDNDQSISETHGGIYKNLAKLRETNGQASDNLFVSMGLDYVYEANGNDIEALIRVFSHVKNAKRPVVVHICTQKGKGYAPAEQNKEQWHWCMPFDRETGESLISFDGPDYTGIAREFVMDRAKRDPSFVVITPNMPGALGLSESDRRELGAQFVDVGIAEEQAVAMASGLAKRGAKPLVVTNTTFMQRTYDQISHDVCINRTAPVFLLNYNSFDGLTDVTHLGIFGLSLFSNIPDLIVCAPSSRGEMLAMLEYALDQDENPFMILMPGNEVDDRPMTKSILPLHSYEITQSGAEIAIIALGDFYQRGVEVTKRIQEELGLTPTLINARYASVDRAVLDNLKQYRLIVTMEDGVTEGGFGQKIASYLGDKPVKVKNFGFEKRFYDRYDPEELLRSEGMDPDSIVSYIKEVI